MTPVQPAIDEAALAVQLEEYHIARAKLVEEERALRHDYDFRQRMSPMAKRAAAIVAKVRSHEAETIWREEGKKDIFPGMSFTLARDRIEHTMLWKIVQRLPKGALLHAHLEAMVDMNWILDQALATEGMCIYSPVPLTSENMDTAPIEFKFSPTQPADCASIYTTSYPSNALVPVRTAADTFPLCPRCPTASPACCPTASPTTSRAAFRAWFVSRTTITAHESLQHHEGVDKIWTKFESVFGIVHGLIFYLPIFTVFLPHLFTQLLSDGISHADLRMAFLMQPTAADGTPVPRSTLLEIFHSAVSAFKKAHPSFWGATIIWTTLRRLPSALIRTSMAECISTHLTVGPVSAFDLVGQEDSGRTTSDLVADLLYFRALCTANNIEIPLYLHAGESLRDAPDNLYDALLLGCNRIGHGFNIYRHPLLLRLARERGVVLEVCPVSNEILRLTASILQHPVAAIAAHGVAVAVSNDDPGILGQRGVSHDYWQVLQAFEEVGLAGVGDMAETGVKAAVPEMREAWVERWEEFCKWVVEEFGEWEG